MLASGVFIYKLVINNSAGTKDGKKAIEVGPLYETEEFTVNMAGTINHYIKAKFALEVTDEKVSKEIEERWPLLKDAIIRILSEQTEQTLLDSKGKEMLKQKLIKAMNNFLETGTIKQVYFETWLFT
jgi:flagellar FliL protein